MRKAEGEWESEKPVSQSKGRTQEDRTIALQKILQDQITIDSKILFRQLRYISALHHPDFGVLICSS